MEISDRTKSLSSEINTDSSSESGDSNITENNFWCGYVGEPEYDKEELKSMEFSDDKKTNSNEEETNLNSSRQENFYCCKCSHCTIMPTFIERKCCKEFKDLLDDKLSAGCVANH